MDASTLVGNARRASKRSYRALAASANVAVSTITRIEAGATDPTFTTMDRLLGSCGYTLVAVRAPSTTQPHLAELASAWALTERGEAALDWTLWRALLDELALHPEWIPEAIYTPPPPAGHPVVDALLAGVAEKLADDIGLLRPSWTRSVPGLDRPFEPPARRSGNVPTQFAARGLIIDGASLFRDRTTARV